MGVENGYPPGEDSAKVKEFHESGARYLRSRTTAITNWPILNRRRDGWQWHGVSPLGKQVPPS
jgi:hypothetical protein